MGIDLGSFLSSLASGSFGFGSFGFGSFGFGSFPYLELFHSTSRVR